MRRQWSPACFWRAPRRAFRPPLCTRPRAMSSCRLAPTTVLLWFMAACKMASCWWPVWCSLPGQSLEGRHGRLHCSVTLQAQEWQSSDKSVGCQDMNERMTPPRRYYEKDEAYSPARDEWRRALRPHPCEDSHLAKGGLTTEALGIV